MNTEAYPKGLVKGQEEFELIHALSRLPMQYLTQNPHIQIGDKTIAINEITALNLKDTYITELPESIGNLSGLQILNLAGTQIQELPESIGNLSRLQSLNLSETRIQELPESIGNLNSLQSLNLSETRIQELPESIWKQSSLQSLDLSETQIQELPESIGNLSSLQSLNLSGTRIQELPESIENLNSLQSLDLSRTQIQELPESIGKLRSLQSLDLSRTQIQELPESIGNLNSLQSLNLSETRIQELPESIGNLNSLQSLDLSGTQIQELPESIGNLSNLQSLGLSRTQIQELPESIGKLSSLQSLSLSYMQIQKLPESIGNLGNLQSLDLSFTKIQELQENICNLNDLQRFALVGTQIQELPESIGKLSSLQGLNLIATQIQELPESIWNLSSLQSLVLSYTKIQELSESIGNLSGLQNLYLGGTQIQELPESIWNLSSLQILDLSVTQIQELPESIGNLNSLQSLDLSRTQIQELPESIGNLNSLQSLDLSRTQIQELPESIENLNSLQSLNLSETRIQELPESIGNLSDLQILNLAGTQIQELPESIGKLRSLQNLDLRELHLSKIDRYLINLNIPFLETAHYFIQHGINIKGLSIDTQPVSLFLQPRPLIEEYFASEMAAVNTVKCIILGYGNVGKTYTLLRMLNEGEEGDYATNETPGVEIRPYVVKNDARSFTINFWDFGGQEIMYSMHRCFLTERSCYLIVVDNRRSDMDMMAQARYWLKNIASFASGAPVVIMANMWEKDEYRDDIEIKRLREEFGKSVDLKCVIPISAKTSSKQQFRQFMDRLIDLAAGMVSCDMEFPVKWNQIRSELHEMGQEHRNYYISQEDYYSICSKNGVDNRSIQNWLLEWFNDLGDCFSYYKPDANDSSSILKEYKVLDPRWITNAIYILITRGYGFVDHQRSPGILTRVAIEKILEKAEGGVVDYIREYKDYECSYIMRVMEKFELAYDVAKDGNKFFIPALLTKKEPEQKRPEEYKQLVKYVLKYDFLPSNTLHKLMVRFFDELELSRCWDKGMVLRNAAIDQWVLLDMGGGDDKLRIEVFACGEDPACKMLNLMLYRLQNVNESLSLKPVHFIVTPDENEEEVKVEHLLELKNGPRSSSIYQGEKKDYSIDELLGNMFGLVADYVEKNSTEEPDDGSRIESYTAVLLEGIRKMEEDKELSVIFTRRQPMERNIYIKDGIYNEHADQASQTIHGDIHNNQDQSKDIEKLTDLLYDNLPVLTAAVQEIAKSDEKLAGDLRDINVQMTMARAKKEEAIPAKKNLIQRLSTSADLITITQALLAAATTLNNPALTDTILRLMQSV